MAPKPEGIKVTVRFRPMNSKEQEQPGNHVCTKLSSCGRAAQITNPDRPEKPTTFYFDTIYGPTSTQEDVYAHSGKPLVEAMKQGYNSTIFAYGQTGSGKTWSMMGTITGAMRGIQPRIIEDVYDYIENETDPADQWTVQISMCEIYLERVKDLFNPIENNMKVKQDSEGSIYIEGITEQHCASTEEVLAAMERGFMNRATSSTKQNAESSRSHCVTIVKTTCHKADGSTIVSKIKMVDLAGSEKTRKTEATGQRLLEAQNINKSLTALSQVLNALCKNDGGFVPYRNSKLTRILQDALGGNSKTSLIVAASPCSYNVEETISALRFGERAKKVKTNAKINKELSAGEMGKEIKKLEKQVEILTYDNELLTAQKDALFGFLTEHGHSGEDVVKDVKHPSEADEEKDMDIGAFEQVSDVAFMVDKTTGRVVAGDANALNASGRNASKARQAKLVEQKRREAEQNAKLAEQAAALIRRGDYAGLSVILDGKVKLGGGVSSQFVDELQDNLADLRAELRGADALNEQLQDELEDVEDARADQEHELSALQSKLAEYRFYKQKVDFLEREYELEQQRAKEEGPAFDASAVATDLDFTTFGPLSTEARTKMEQLAFAVQRQNKMLQNYKAKATLNTDELIEALQGSGSQQEAMKKVLKSYAANQHKLTEAQTTTDKAKRALAMLQKRDKFNKQLQGNWKNQLKQMEKAVLMCADIQKRDRTAFQAEIAQKDGQIEKLKLYIQKTTEMYQRKSQAKSMARGSGAARIRNAIGRDGRRRVSKTKKRRPARALSVEMDAASVRAL